MRRMFFVGAWMLASALFTTTPAMAEIRIIQSPGGEVGPFLDLFEQVRESGERVVIDGRGTARPLRPVRDWISRHGGLSSRLLLLKGRDLAAIYPRCR